MEGTERTDLVSQELQEEADEGTDQIPATYLSCLRIYRRHALGLSLYEILASSSSAVASRCPIVAIAQLGAGV